MRVLVDTNVLTGLVQNGSELQSSMRLALRELMRRGDHLLIVPQVIYEFWVVATRPVAVNGLGYTVARARDELANMRDVFSLARDERAIFDHWQTLVIEKNVQGKNAHDARLVSAAIRHRCGAILTRNVADFSRYSSIIVINAGNVAT